VAFVGKFLENFSYDIPQRPTHVKLGGAAMAPATREVPDAIQLG
jgi:hypothetical protein